MIDESKVIQVVAVLERRSDTLAQEGNFSDSGILLMARQTIRVLWTALQQQCSSEPKPSLSVVPDQTQTAEETNA